MRCAGKAYCKLYQDKSQCKKVNERATKYLNAHWRRLEGQHIATTVSISICQI